MTFTNPSIPEASHGCASTRTTSAVSYIAALVHLSFAATKILEFSSDHDEVLAVLTLLPAQCKFIVALMYYKPLCISAKTILRGSVLMQINTPMYHSSLEVNLRPHQSTNSWHHPHQHHNTTEFNHFFYLFITTPFMWRESACTIHKKTRRLGLHSPKKVASIWSDALAPCKCVYSWVGALLWGVGKGENETEDFEKVHWLLLRILLLGILQTCKCAKG